MLKALTDLLDLPENARPLEVARAVEQMEVMLRYQARQGHDDASHAMLQLRQAYLLWAYAPQHRNMTKAYSSLTEHG